MIKRPLLLIPFALLYTGCATVGSPAASSTKIYIQQNDLQKAEENANKWISDEPNSPKPYIWRGFIYTRKGEYIKASEDFLKAFLLDPTYKDKKRFEKELSIAGQSLMPYEAVATVLQNAAIQSVQNEKYDDAIKYLDEAKRIDPNNANIYLLLHSIYNAKGDEEKSREYLEKAVSIDPKNPKARLQLAVLYSFEGKKDTAEKILRGILKDTVMVEAYKELGILLFEKGDHKGAAENLQKAYELKPNDYEILANLGRAYAELKEYDKAFEYLKKAYELKSDEYRIPFSIAGVLYDAKRYNDALKYINEAINLNPDEPTLYELRGAIYRALGKKRESLNDFKKAEELRKSKGKGK
ncbi:MAG: tetratricopeptide repeat protein [candidate division WOR-3 bacterium]